MKIIILGSGDVGGTLAEYLVADSSNNITVIDNDVSRLQQLQERYDLRTIYGHAAYPNILKDAGAEDADILLAVTNSDETNIVACQIAYLLYGTPNRIARIRAKEYVTCNEEEHLFSDEKIPINHIITPERLVTEYIYNLVKHPGAHQVTPFIEGKVFLTGVTAYYGGRLVGDELIEINNHLPIINTRIAGIFRRGRPIQVQGTTVIEAGDEIFFVSEEDHIDTIIGEFQRAEKHYKKIMIVGGGNIGVALATLLEKNHQVKIIERNLERATEVSERLQNTLVLHGEASDKDLLSEEHIEQMDIFIAVTNDDEANIMSAILAKKLGVPKTIVLIQRHVYVNLLQEESIDISISPQQITVSALLNYTLSSNITKVVSLRNSASEAIEIVIQCDDEADSKVIGKHISEIKLPPATVIAAIVRDDEVLIANSDFILLNNDRLVMFLADKKHIQEIERIFEIA